MDENPERAGEKSTKLSERDQATQETTTSDKQKDDTNDQKLLFEILDLAHLAAPGGLETMIALLTAL